MGKYSAWQDQRLLKTDIAKFQLEDAIDLFLKQKFLSAITLAGAADGIFSGMLGDKQSVHVDAWRQIERLRSKTGLQINGQITKKETFNLWNRTRNTLKHHDHNKDDDDVTVNTFDEAYDAINRALAGAQKLEISIANRDKFENWVIENINLGTWPDN